METEKRLIDPDGFLKWVVKRFHCVPLVGSCDNDSENMKFLLSQAPTVNAVILPYKPRPMLKDRNPNNLDVYCPECGTNLSGYYGEERLPIVTCFFCGEILDPCKATTGTNGERVYDG